MRIISFAVILYHFSF